LTHFCKASINKGNRRILYFWELRYWFALSADRILSTGSSLRLLLSKI